MSLSAPEEIWWTRTNALPDLLQMTFHKKLDGWFKPRTYTHLDYPKTFEQANALVKDVTRLISHSVLPFLAYIDEKRRYQTDNSDRTIAKRLRPRMWSVKSRDIMYASHADSAIFAFYAMQLQSCYEKQLNDQLIDKNVTGYRSGKGSNIDFAAEAFSELTARGSATAICCDISDFFPSIQHDNLKRQLQNVLDTDPLPDVWYKIFRRMTKYSYINIDKLYSVEGINSKNVPRPLVSDIQLALNRFRSAKIVITNYKSHGIPQGSPISAVLANISMLEFDKRVAFWADQNGSFYRRYSDDILLIVEPCLEVDGIEMIVNSANSSALQLKVNPGKTEISRFDLSTKGKVVVDRPFTYLGFTFDGRNVSLRARTLSRYYRRMTYATRSASKNALKSGSKVSKTFKRTLISDFTHLGSANLYSYARRVDSKMVNAVAKRQLRKHFQIMLRKILYKGR